MARTAFGGSLVAILVIGALFSLVMGMAGAILIAYILSVIVVIPTIVDAGVPVLPAHLFSYYFAIMAYITPPICSACFVATRFVDASYWKIGWESIKLALPLWILPFVFVYRPELLLMQGGLVDILTVIVIAAGGMILLAAAIRGMLITRLGIVERLVCLVGSVLLLLPNMTFDLVGGAIVVIIVVWQVMKWTRGRGERTGQQPISQQ